jgi:hypothetical protein
LHWDADGWDFEVASESDDDLTDGDDLKFLFDGELDSDTSTGWSWTYDGESSDVESFDNDDDPMSVHWMVIGSSDDKDDNDENDGSSSEMVAVTRTATVVTMMTPMMMAGQANAMRCLPGSVVGCCMVAYSGRNSSSLY